MTPAHAAFGWSARAWSHPWRAFLRAHPDLHVADALEVGAGPHSSLAPALLPLAERVECSAFDAATLSAIRARNARFIAPADQARVRYTRQDVRALAGVWDLIVLKSVLGGVHRVGTSRLGDVHQTVAATLQRHLRPGGWLLSLDNGVSALAPLAARLGARRNGWRFFAAHELPPADARWGFGVLGIGSAATRLGALGHAIDDAVYAADLVLSPFARRHAVLLSAWQRAA